MLTSSTQQDDTVRLLDAASDPVRLGIVFLLGGAGRTNVGDIANRFPRMSRPAISHHLRVLREAGVVRSERTGQEIHYWLDRDRVVSGLRSTVPGIGPPCARSADAVRPTRQGVRTS